MPVNVNVALYLDPHTTVAAQSASFVVGSTANGTMSKISKLVIATQKAARQFAETCGGEALSFQKTFKLAMHGLKK